LHEAPVAMKLIKKLAVVITVLLSPMGANADLIKSYDFDGDLSDTLGNGVDLTDSGGIVSGGRYSFSHNEGLRLTSALPGTTDYGIELSFQVNDDLANWNKIIDFADLTLDFGLTVFDGGIDFWTIGPMAGSIVLDTDVTIAIARAGGVVDIFLNGALLFRAADAAGEAVSPANILNFFEDDFDTGQSESFIGSVDFIRIHHDSSTFGTTPVPVPVPEPTTLSLLGAGLFGISLMRRRRRIA